MRRRWCCLWLIALTVTVGARQDRGAASRSPAWTAFVERVLAEPDHVGDLSAAAFGEDLVRTRATLAELRATDASRLSTGDALDRRFVETLLVRREIEQAQMRRWRIDPRVYMRSLDAIADRLEDEDDDAATAVDVLHLLRALPQDLRFGRRNLTLSAPVFQLLALAMASEAGTTLATRVTALAGRVPDQKDAILTAGAVARAALNDWIDYLSKELPKRPTGYTGVGIPTYGAILRDQYLLQDSADRLYDLLGQEFARTQEQLENLAADVDDARPWMKVAGDGGDNVIDDIDGDKVAALYLAAGEAARANLDAERLVAVPWTSSLHEWRFAAGHSAGETLFGKLDPAVVSIHAYAAYGDRIRALYQAHNTSAARRERRVSTYTEGWRLYVEQMMEAHDLLPDDHTTLRFLQLRLLAIARASADISLHTHRMTEAQAVAFLIERVGLTRAAAEREIAAIIDDPGSGLGYVGLTEITRLRDDVEKARGGAFSLTEFHEQLLKIGPLPLALARAALLP
jgi:uncharacterized protein DUF885